jgi:predicted permease
MHATLVDLRYALRSLRRSPLLVVVTVMSLAVGVGATTSVFSIVNAFMFKPATGLGEPERLVTLYTSDDDGDPKRSLSFPDYESVMAGVNALDGVTAFSFDIPKLGEGAGSRVALAQVVSGNFFTVLGIDLPLGRGFTAEETRIGEAHRVVVIGDRFWRSQLGGRPDVLGQTIRLNGQLFTIVGVTPKGLGSRIPALVPEVWIPIGIPGMSVTRSLEELNRRHVRQYMVMGRLAPDATIPQVQAQLDALATKLAEEYPAAWIDARGQQRSFSLHSEEESRLMPGMRYVLTLIASFLLVTTSLVLFIACSNITSLSLARVLARRRELAVRVSMGAGRRRIAALVLLESVLLGVPGGLLGLVMVFLFSRRFAALDIGFVPLRFDFAIDIRVLLFTLLLSVMASAMIAITPALQACRFNLSEILKGERAGGVTGRRARARRFLVVVQVAASLTLLAGAGLFMRSLTGATRMDLGIKPDQIVVMGKSLPPSVSTLESHTVYVQDLLSRLSSRPGVADVQAAANIEMTIATPPWSNIEITSPSQSADDAGPLTVSCNSVTPGYLEMIGVRLLRGRSLSAGDGAGSVRVAVVNEEFARTVFPDHDAIGQRFETLMSSLDPDRAGKEPQMFEIVGVAEDGKYGGDIDEEPGPYFWASLWQQPAPWVAIAVKGRTGTREMMTMLRREVEIGEGEIILTEPTPLATMIDLQFLHLRVAAKVMGWGGAFGLILAVMGIYGLVSFAAAQRTREMAIRIAVGAPAAEVLGLIAREGINLALIGLAVGVVLVVPLAYAVRSQLFGMSPLDPLALGGSAAILLLAALAAVIYPAWRSTRLQPMSILREE